MNRATSRSRSILVSLCILATLGSSGLIGAPDPAPRPPAPAPAEYAGLRERAEARYAEGSYALAQRLYEEAAALDLPAAEKRWVEFRIADTTWRARAAATTHDETVFEQARQRLEAVIGAIGREDDRDRVWAEAHESLGDFWWMRDGRRDWGTGWPHYQQALDWWAGASDLDTARRRYLDMVWRVAQPPWMRQSGGFGYSYLPLPVLENARIIARHDDDRARAHFLLATALRQYGHDWRQRARIEENFETAIAFGALNPWYDDALFQYADWLSSTGRVVVAEDGSWRVEPDYVEALELFRRLVRDFRKGESRYVDDAKGRIEQITGPELTAAVSTIFLPGSEIRFDLHWRNVKTVDLALHPVDLTRDLDPTRSEQPLHRWIEHVDPAGAAPAKSWTFDTGDDGRHRPGHAPIRLDAPLETGAYLLTARAAGRTVRELVLVTDATVVIKTWRDRVLAWMCDARTGKPIQGAQVRACDYRYASGRWTGIDLAGATGDDGLSEFTIAREGRGNENRYGVLVTAAAGGRQAFALGSGFAWPAQPARWKVYATTDRPAYRPEETVRWKVTARTNDGGGYATPAGASVEYQLTDPRGATVEEGTLALNAFGSAWSEMVLSPAHPLGPYSIAFWDQGRKTHIGGAVLFRLEEYKLPEFEVAVRPPRDDAGRPKTFRLGDPVEITIASDYYFGAPVANANVQVIVYQRPFQHWWTPPRPFPWCYDDPGRGWWNDWYGPGQIVRQEVVRSDDAGVARLTIETPAGQGQDLEYTIEARVTDASRREVTGQGLVRVTRQGHYVYPQARQSLYAPGDTVEIDFKALDANENPVVVSGEVTVTRRRWVETWIDPKGRKATGDAAGAGRAGEAGWRLEFQGYESEKILARTLKTDEEGQAMLSFAARDEGYYAVEWRSTERRAGEMPVVAETTVWVADDDTTKLGYRHGGVEIIVDADTFRAGATATVMLSVPANDKWVLFSVEGHDLYERRLVHVPGTVKLLHLPIERRHIPNVFLQALMVSDGRIFADQEQIVVPPVEEFLQVELSPDREAYEPRSEGTWTITTRDHAGKPVAAEVALAVVDESVFAIQPELAPDPREFFYSDRQGLIVQTTSTFDQRSYAKLVPEEKEENRAANDRDGAALEAGMAYKSVGGDHRGRRELGLAAAERSDLADEVMGRPMAPAAAPMAGQMIGGGKGGGGGGEPNVVVRTDFRSTILWKPDLVTGRDGTATLSAPFADSLTRWKATARAFTEGARTGLATATARTRQPLIARLQGPRFFVVGDTVTLSGVLNNDTDEPMTATAGLDARGVSVVARLEDGRPVAVESGPITIAPGREARIDWHAVVEEPGAAVVRLTARAGAHHDAMELTWPVYEHGVERFIATSGKVRGEEVVVHLDLPAARRRESTAMEVQVTSSLAVTALDALPYLVDYPYGCTEQTMSRFLPAAITAKTLESLGLPPEEALGRVFGGIERDVAAKTHPGGERKRANLAKLDEIVRAGLERLEDFQHGDGGWGWWKEGESDHFMTAYVAWGLALCREAGIEVRGDVLARAARFLEVEIVEEEDRPDLQAWMLHALAAHHRLAGSRPAAPTRKAALNVWEKRDALPAYARALFALALHDLGENEKALTIVRNLENGVDRDDAPDASVLLGTKGRTSPAVMSTAHWGSTGAFRRWSDGGVEATAFALRALMRIDPGNALVEPVTNWLVRNRRGAQWSNTRDTAITVLALNDYLRKSGELEPVFEYEVRVNGVSIATRRVTAAEALSAPSRFPIDPEYVRDGRNEIRIIRKNGAGAIYFAASAEFFSLEEPIPPAGNEIFVRRDYFKLVPRETLLKGFVYDREVLPDGGYVRSGERVEVVVTIEAKNDCEYLVFEDLKPAGLESAALRSGEGLDARELTSAAVARAFGAGEGLHAPAARIPDELDHEGYTGRGRRVHQELRDRTVALFVDRLPQGHWEVRYDLRAEVPGSFHALPLLGHAMYVPEIRCNSAEVRVTVSDEPQAVTQAE